MRSPPSHAFVDVALDLSATMSPEDRYRRLLTAIRHALPVDGGMLLRREGDTLYPVAISNMQARVLAMAFSASHTAVAGDVEGGKAVRTIGRVGLLADYADVVEKEQPPGVLVALPLVVEDEVVGALNLGAKDKHAFDDIADADFALYAALAAAALRTADLIDALERESDRRQRVALDMQRNAAQRVEGPLLGSSAAIRRARKAVEEAALHDGPVLIIGPQGAGREATARAIHGAGARSEHAFIFASSALSRAEGTALFAPESAGDSKLVLARGGTLYLDAVELLDPADQQALAALLGNREGAATNEARIIAALSQPDNAPMLETTLRDILMRGRLDLPGLGARREDISIIAQHYASRFSKRIHGSERELSLEAIERLEAYDWPGNVAELRNVIERAVVTSRGAVIEVPEALLREARSLGNYTLIEPLGEGGMGSVWLANHKYLSRPAAVKVIHPEALTHLGDREILTRRFKREAEATANLRSMHTVEIYDFGVSEEGAFYYVMERLHGMDLEHMVEAHGPLPPERVVHLLMQACRSLGEAHSIGVAHRDVKPANLFICGAPDHDFLKLLDFGLVTTLFGGAQSGEDPAVSPTEATLPDPMRFTTMFENVQGTPAFLAPEVIAGVASDGRADLYALGCVGFYMLEGRPPFEASDITKLLIMHLRNPPPRIMARDVPLELEHVIRGCLAKDPSRRPPTAAALSKALAGVPLKQRWDDERTRRWWQTHGDTR